MKKQLRGVLSVPVHSAVKGKPVVSYYPGGNPADPGAIIVELGTQGAQHLRQGHSTSLQLVFKLPATASPQDLNGIVSVEALGLHHKAKGSPLTLSVTGTSALTGVVFQPEQLKIETTGSDPSAEVKLLGPGVPSLFQKGTKPPSFELLLHSDRGDDVTARLTGLEQSQGNSTIAQGTVEIEGDLKPGKYEGATPLSSLSPEAPKIAVTVEAGKPFTYALVLVAIGTLLGGALYLVSGRRRRKILFRNQVNAILKIYETKLQELEDQHGRQNGKDTPLPVKPLDKYLGPKQKWHRLKWNAIVEFDGAVQAIWSAIHWARDDNDLNEVGKQVDTLRGKVFRWVRIANCVSALESAAELKPDDSVARPWKPRLVRRDTNFLLRRICEIEPVDDQTAESLEDRIARQAHWHTVLARVWQARRTLEIAMDNDPDERVYDAHARTMFRGLDLEGLDKKASPESARTAEKQIEVEQELADYMEQIVTTYKGDRADLFPSGATTATAVAKGESAAQAAPAVEATDAIYGLVDLNLEMPTITDPEREKGEGRAGYGAGKKKKKEKKEKKTAGESSGNNIAREIFYRDAIWTAAVAVATSAAYAATLYNGTWGTTRDYVSAFTAGFLGKAAVNWAALPLFQSLRSISVTAPTATDAKTEPDAAAATAEAGATADDKKAVPGAA